MKALAAGQCPQRELAAAHRHLAECARCRAAVVAAACGVQGPGETVLMKRSASPADSIGTGWKVAAVAASVLAAGATWRFAGAGRAEAPVPLSAHVPPVPVAAPRGEPAMPAPAAFGSAEPSTLSHQLLGSPRAPAGPAVRPVAPALEPEHELDRRASSEPPEPGVLSERVGRAALPARAAAAEAAARREPEAARESPPRATEATRSRRATPAPTQKVAAKEIVEEYDFGIDEVAPASSPEPPPDTSRPAIKGRPIRTTLD